MKKLFRDIEKVLLTIKLKVEELSKATDVSEETDEAKESFNA